MRRGVLERDGQVDHRPRARQHPLRPVHRVEQHRVGLGLVLATELLGGGVERLRLRGVLVLRRHQEQLQRRDRRSAADEGERERDVVGRDRQDLERRCRLEDLHVGAGLGERG